MSITLYHGDTLDILPTLAPESVQAIVTSPPYFGLRNYGIPPSQWPAIAYAPMAALPDVAIPEQVVCLGLETDPLFYVGHLVHVFRLARAALKDDGVLLLNLGDSYTASGKGGNPSDSPYAGFMGNSEREAQAKAGTKNVPAGLKPKDLLCIPHRVAMALQADGWYLRMDAVWHKPNAMPESVKDRPTRSHEYVFLLAKSARYFWDADAVSEAANEHSAAAASFKRTDNKRSESVVPGSPATHRADRDDVLYSGETRNLRSVWTIATQPLADAHYAPMPQTLVERCIKASTRPGDTVLDPFGGSGTTARTAERLQRHAIHIDLAYQAIAEKRTDGVQVEMVI